MKKTWGKAGSKPIQKQEEARPTEPVTLKAAKIVDKEPIQKSKVVAPALKPTPARATPDKDSRPSTPTLKGVTLRSTPRGSKTGTPRAGTPREGTPARDMVQLKPVLKVGK